MMDNTNNLPYAHGCGAKRMTSGTLPHARDQVEIKSQIHGLEREAYGSVLRAFIARSDLLSWGKEGLITKLRKELHVTDIEHGELLVKITSDETIKMIREWRKGASRAREPRCSEVKSAGFAANSEVVAFHKKMRTSHASLSPQKHVTHSQPSSSTLEHEKAILQALTTLADVLDGHRNHRGNLRTTGGNGSTK